MRQRIYYTGLLCLLLTLTSCFEVLEEANIHEDGTGEYTLTVNLSQSKTKITSIMLLDSINSYKVPSKSDIQKGISEIETYIKKTPGITNVRKKEDFDNYIFSIHCSFDNIATISTITREALKKQKTISNINLTYAYSSSDNRFTKKFTYDPEIHNQYKKLSQDNQEVFTGAIYTSIYRFPKKITSFTNKKARVSKTGKAIMLRNTITELINGTAIINNTIQL